MSTDLLLPVQTLEFKTYLGMQPGHLLYCLITAVSPSLLRWSWNWLPGCFAVGCKELMAGVSLEVGIRDKSGHFECVQGKSTSTVKS